MDKILSLIAGFFVTADLFVWWRGFEALRRRRQWSSLRWAYSIFMLYQIIAFSALLSAAMANTDTNKMYPTVVAISLYLWHLLVLPVALTWHALAFIAKMAGWCANLVRQIMRKRAAASEPIVSPPKQVQLHVLPSPGITRREFLGATAALTPPMLSLALTAMAEEQLQKFRIRKAIISLPGLPRDLDGLTVAHVSDTHIGRFTHGKVMQRVTDATNALRADLVVFTGDLVNDSLTWLPPSIEMLKKIDNEVVICEGNHDLVESAYLFRTRVRAAGLRLLVNETATLKRRGCNIQFLGLPWSGPDHESRGEANVAAASSRLLKLRDRSAFPIVLAHHPHAWDYLGDLPLVLSGHTHGGQLMLTESLGAGPILFRYWTGLYTKGDRRLFISNGVGNWFPLRISAPAEIVHLTLRSSPLVS